MAPNAVLIPRQVYSNRSAEPIHTPKFDDAYFETIRRSLKEDTINHRVLNAIQEWTKYEDNHEIILFDNLEPG